MPDTPLHYQTIAEVGARLQSKQVSPVELTSAILERIEALDGDLKSYATLMAESAMASARTAEQEIAAGNYRGGLHGVPIAVKDLCFTTGVATMGGARVLRTSYPTSTHGGAETQRRRCSDSRQAESHRRSDGRFTTRSSRYRSIPGAPTAGLERLPAAREWRLPPDCATARWAATPAARSGSRQPPAASWESSPPGVG